VRPPRDNAGIQKQLDRVGAPRGKRCTGTATCTVTLVAHARPGRRLRVGEALGLQVGDINVRIQIRRNAVEVNGRVVYGVWYAGPPKQLQETRVRESCRGSEA
jgi:hypothetical protein